MLLQNARPHFAFVSSGAHALLISLIITHDARRAAPCRAHSVLFFLVKSMEREVSLEACFFYRRREWEMRRWSWFIALRSRGATPPALSWKAINQHTHTHTHEKLHFYLRKELPWLCLQNLQKCWWRQRRFICIPLCLHYVSILVTRDAWFCLSAMRREVMTFFWWSLRARHPVVKDSRVFSVAECSATKLFTLLPRRCSQESHFSVTWGQGKKPHQEISISRDERRVSF